MKTTFVEMRVGAKFFTPSMAAHLLVKIGENEAVTYHDGKKVAVPNVHLRVECITPLMVDERKTK